MKRKKILFVLHTMNIGGMEKAFLGTLTNFPQDEYDIHVAFLEKKGELLSFLPSYVSTDEISGYLTNKAWINLPPLRVIAEYVKRRQWLLSIQMLIDYTFDRIEKTSFHKLKRIFSKIPVYQGNFDIAVAYAGPFAFIDYFVTKKVIAKEKWVWIHYDISRNGSDSGVIGRLYDCYDKINIVSKQGKAVFDQRFPQFSDRTRVCYNVIAKDHILTLGEEPVNLTINEGVVYICTVGRISKEKGQRLAIEALRLLKESSYHVMWNFVGAGPDFDHCKTLVKEYGLAKETTFVGSTTNPYPWMKLCDIYVQPSEHEGYCITLAEAKLFNPPIITTDFTGAREQLQGYPQAAIVNYNAVELYEAIKNMILVQNINRARRNVEKLENS